MLLGPGAELLPGTRLGSRYTVIRLLGRGGMGAVYQAYDDELGVAVAIKTILPGQADEYTRRDQVSRFKSELLLARQVTHKNVVRIHDLGEVGGLKYITMSYIEGETLAALIKRLGAVPVPQALSLARQIAAGMAAAHDAGVIHRDLKPENVIVNRDGQALIMDFGIAHSSAAGAAGGGAMTGTIAYMAPEQATGKPVDARADIYAFGLIVYDMLVGRQRLKAHASPLDEMRARFVAPPTPARHLRPEVPEAFDALVTRAVQPDPEARFADSAALGAAFEALDDDGTLRPIEKPRARWPAVTAAMLVTALLVTGVWRWISPPPVAAKPPVSVLIADFQNRTGDPVFNGVLEQALGLGIEGASFITAYPRRDALRVAASVRPGRPLDEETARVVALSEGVGIVLVSEIAAENGGYRLSTRALRGDLKAEQVSAAERRSRRARMACSRPSACWPARFVRRWVTPRRRRRTRAPARRSPLPPWRRRAPTPARRKRNGPATPTAPLPSSRRRWISIPRWGEPIPASPCSTRTWGGRPTPRRTIRRRWPGSIG